MTVLSELPSLLPAAQKRALQLVGRTRMIRRTGGWIASGGARVSLAVADQAMRHGLLRIDRTGQQLVLTGAGRTLLDVMEQRQARRIRA